MKFKCVVCDNESTVDYEKCPKCIQFNSYEPLTEFQGNFYRDYVKNPITIKERINQLLDQQNAKGLREYGISLDDVDVNSYDWKNEMIMELIDALQYQTKEIVKLEEEIKRLQEENK